VVEQIAITIMSTDDLRISYRNFELRKPDPNLHRDLERGWLLPYLLRCDELTWDRWGYWYRLMLKGALPPEQIPQIEFLSEGGRSGGQFTSDSAGWSRVMKLWEHNFDQVAPYWQGWGSREYIEYVLDWLLFGFGANAEAPKELTPGSSDRLYQTFDLGPMLLWPYDYLGDIFAEMAIGKHAGFYPTPHSVVKMMVDVLMVDKTDKDMRLATTCDPCSGTGRMLLFASNHSLCLAGQDVNPLVVKASLVNGFLYAPWMVKPIQWAWEQSNAPHGANVNGEHIPPGMKLTQGALL
jgi:hypothetical protein